MISLLWTFVGALVGMLIVAVFSPPPRDETGVPTPDSKKTFHTKNGCVKFKATEVPCDGKQTSLNLLAPQ
uniref:Uncharacterized protein n=1 Tax=viral metagenome TaxID=1070528 RepID=A0A6C0AI21_9ZZZZ